MAECRLIDMFPTLGLFMRFLPHPTSEGRRSGNKCACNMPNWCTLAIGCPEGWKAPGVSSKLL